MVDNFTINRIDPLGMQTIAPPSTPLPSSPASPNPYESPNSDQERQQREALDDGLGMDCRSVKWTGKYRSKYQKSNTFDTLATIYTFKPSMPKSPTIPRGGRYPNDQFPGLPNTSTDDAPDDFQENLNGYTMLDSWTLQNSGDRPKPNDDEFEASEKFGKLKKTGQQILEQNDIKITFYHFGERDNSVRFCKICKDQENSDNSYAPSPY